MKVNEHVSLFGQFKDGILNIDPVYFCEKYLTVDGKPLRLNGSGYKPFADIYRYIGLKATEPNAKPIVLVKGRQVGATTMAAALECYFAGCGVYGKNGRPPMRMMHLFPTLSLAAAYTKDKFDPMIGQAKPVPGTMKANGLPKSFMENIMDSTSPANNNQHFKKFLFGNQVWIESTGLDGDRVRGRQLCLETELPTPEGFTKLKDLKEGDQLFDENGNICNITQIHPINTSPESYRIIFDDGATVDACVDHLWSIYSSLKRTKKDITNIQSEIKNTKDIIKGLRNYNQSISLCKPVEYSEKNLSIDPYDLGFWLGSNGGDDDTLNNDNQNKDWVVSRSRFYRVIRNKVGCSVPEERCIPREYIQSSVSQRSSLLQGLLDSAGNCYDDGRCEFCQEKSKKDLVDQIVELLHSLGFKTSVSLEGDNYYIYFTTTSKERRFITDVIPIDSKPMRCITVDSPSHLYLITRYFIPTHNTVDTAFFDECQDMNPIAIGATTKTLAQAQYGPGNQGVQVYFGTPKTKAGSYWAMWQASSQNYYHLGCERCGEFFPLYRPDVDWEDIWIYGLTVRCPSCGCEQNKLEAQERGKWIPFNDPEDSPFIGYHINQLFIPGNEQSPFTKEVIDRAKPENNPINTERVFMNEVLGEFFDGESGTITVDEIRSNCLDENRRISARLDPRSSGRAYGGFDWGQRSSLELATGRARGRSYSCGVILVPDGNVFNVEFATRLMKNDPEYKEQHVEEMFKRYNLALAVGDIGDAGDLTHRLQKKFDERFLASRASHRITGHIKYSSDEWPKTIVFEKDYYISEVLALLRDGRIRFPKKSYMRIEWLIEHCASMEIKITKDKSGEPLKKFVKGAGQNDGLMALINAYLAWKWDVTGGFNIKNPLYMKYEIATTGSSAQAVVGYIPKMFGSKG